VKHKKRKKKRKNKIGQRDIPEAQRVRAGT